MSTPNANDLQLDELGEHIHRFIDRHYHQDDDTTMPALWAWAVFAEYSRDMVFTIMCDAIDHMGYTHSDVADALGVTRQAVQQRLLRAAGQRVKHTGPDSKQAKLFS